MQIKKGQLEQLKIEKLAFGGRGIGMFEGRPVFVPKTMPGDIAEVSFTKIKDAYIEADFVRLVTPSPERAETKCPHVAICNGCQMQYMPYKKQTKFKKQHVIDSFERIGGFKNPPVTDTLSCNEQFYYRNKMEFSFGYDKNMNFQVGMHVPGRRFDIFDITACMLQSKIAMDILNKTRDLVLAYKWAPFKYSCGEGFVKSLFIREGKRTGQIMINISTSDDIPASFEADFANYIEEILKINDKYSDVQIISINWSKVISKRGHRRQTVTTCMFGQDSITEKMILPDGGELSFEILPHAFFQVNTLQGEHLYNEVMKLASINNHEMIFDLFCGTGTMGLFLAKLGKKVLGIEINEDAVNSAKRNAEVNNVKTIDFYCGDVAKVLGDIKEKPSLIIVDPPRAGLTQKMIDHIHSFGAKEIIYVSCNPATLARDCKIFKELEYKVKSIKPVDMFPHTFHIENVCYLTQS